jgi:Holliday junction resolvase RusA-like endonuclease
MMDGFETFVSGRPRPKGSWKPVRVGVKTRLLPDNARSKPWEVLVHFAAAQAFRGDPWGKDVAVGLHVRFVFRRPKKHFRTGRFSNVLRDDAPRFPIGKPDADKLLRTVMDALTGVVYVDDCQVVDPHCPKVYGEHEGALIRAWIL